MTPDKKWIVFANGAEQESSTDKERIRKVLSENGCAVNDGKLEKMTLKVFEESPAISTYIYGMDAGCYSVVENDNK